MTLTLDIIEQRAKALGWPTRTVQNAFDSPLLRVQTPSGYVVYARDGEGIPYVWDSDPLCRHDLAALESPEPARPVVNPVTGLLPCPFCGARALAGPHSSASIECTGCETRVYGGDAYRIRLAWNRRTP